MDVCLWRVAMCALVLMTVRLCAHQRARAWACAHYEEAAGRADHEDGLPQLSAAAQSPFPPVRL
jgi:hypothetical protein